MNKICPLMSYRQPGAIQLKVQCIETECKLWKNNDCGLLYNDGK